MAPQPYSRMSTPTPGQPFTPSSSLTPSHMPSTPGSGHKLRGGFTSGSLYPSGQSPSTLSQAGSSWADDGTTTNVKGGKLYQKLTIKQSLTQFETVLAQLVGSVSKFQPSVDAAEKLIQADARLNESIAELLEHQKAAEKLLRLRKVSTALDEQLNTLLVTLADCRRTLRGLPRPSEKYVQFFEQKEQGLSVDDIDLAQQPRVSAKDLLHYATKITKFTSAPPGYNQNQPEHANFPWPIEDEMRRGMLALSAIAGTSDQAAQAADGGAAAATTGAAGQGSERKSSDTSNPQQQQQQQASEGAAGSGANAETRRRNSMADYGEQRPAEPSGTAQLDLDLFDPDDDDDDDDDDENMVDI